MFYSTIDTRASVCVCRIAMFNLTIDTRASVCVCVCVQDCHRGRESAAEAQVAHQAQTRGYPQHFLSAHVLQAGRLRWSVH